jgi:hypothetical protein
VAALEESGSLPKGSTAAAVAAAAANRGSGAEEPLDAVGWQRRCFECYLVLRRRELELAGQRDWPTRTVKLMAAPRSENSSIGAEGMAGGPLRLGSCGFWNPLVGLKVSLKPKGGGT